VDRLAERSVGLVTGLRVIVAASDTGMKCCRCGGAIREGHEFATEQWPNGGGWDHMHVSCPEPQRSNDPDKRIIQGAKP
jgi:hypothetical protein